MSHSPPQIKNLLLIQHHDTSREITFRRELPFINTEFRADEVQEVPGLQVQLVLVVDYKSQHRFSEVKLINVIDIY